MMIEDFVKLIMGNALRYLKEIYVAESNGYIINSKPLIFPHYKNRKIRVSEQELRFAFVREFEKLCEEKGIPLHYSVETPTENSYRFTVNNKSSSSDGRSGLFDLVLHNSDGERICLIEFKAGNKGKEELEPSLRKLANQIEGDESVLRFFIHIVESSSAETIDSITNKLAELEQKHSRGCPVHYCCLSLNQRDKNNDAGIIIDKCFNYARPVLY